MKYFSAFSTQYLLFVMFSLVCALACVNPGKPRSDLTAVDSEFDAPSKTQAMVLADPELVREILVFLATPESSPLYQTQRRLVAEKLARLLDGRERILNIALERDGLKFLLPIQLISTDYTARASEHVPILRLQGQILDLVWAGGAREKEKILILFADSVSTISFSKSGRPAIQSFVITADRHAVKSAFPVGRMVAGKGKDEYIFIHSNLKTPQVVDLKNQRIRNVRSTDFLHKTSNPGAWYSQPGRPIYYSRSGGFGAFQDLRRLSADQLLIIDQAGYLKRLDSANNLLWQSKRRWGKQAYLLSTELLAICAEKRNRFTVFRITDDKLQALGESTVYPAEVKAVCAGRFRKSSGLFTATTETLANGQFSNIYFTENSQLNWHLPDSFEEPSYVKYDGTLELFINNYPGSNVHVGEKSYPFPVFSQILETLYSESGTAGQVQLARRITSSVDGKTWDIALPEEIRFSDGSKATAYDVKAGWEKSWRSCNVDKCISKQFLENIAGGALFSTGKRDAIAGLQAIKPNQLRIQLVKPQTEIAKTYLAHSCFAVASYNETGEMLGTGPFKVTRKNSVRVVCARNEFYHRGSPPLKSLIFSAANVKLIDELGLDLDKGGWLRKPEEINYFSQLNFLKVWRLPGKTTYFMAFNEKGRLSFQARRQLIDRLNFKNIGKAISSANFHALTQQENQALNVDADFTQKTVAGPVDQLRLISMNTDDVAQEITERIVVQLRQSGYSIDLTRLQTRENYLERLRSGDYDIVVDCYDAGRLSKISALKRFTENLSLENDLSGRMLWKPIGETENYVVLPTELKSVRLTRRAIDFSKAWLE